MTTVQQLNVDEMLQNPDFTETIPTPDGEPIRILWMSRIPARQRQTVTAVYGPTLRHVEENLGVYLYYDSRMPQVIPTEELIEEATRRDTLEELTQIVHEEGTSLQKYFRAYHAMFGPRRVTFTQLDEVTKAVRKQHGVPVPHKMSWYFRFNGYTSFVDEYLKWLWARGKGRDLPEGEDVLLQEPPIPLDDHDFDY